MSTYEVIVGNIGSVYCGTRRHEAMTHYAEYVRQSQTGRGRAGGEDVTLLKDEDIMLEHTGNLHDWEDRTGDL